MTKPIIVAVSGGFDPVHIGHIRLLQAAKKLGHKLVVILNNDNWLKKKKGFVFMDEKERKAVLEAIRWVDEVVLTSHPENSQDMSVCAELGKVKPDIFCQGGDRNKSNIPPCEVELQKKLGFKIVDNVGGKKAQSSSELVKKVKDVS